MNMYRVLAFVFLNLCMAYAKAQVRQWPNDYEFRPLSLFNTNVIKDGSFFAKSDEKTYQLFLNIDPAIKPGWMLIVLSPTDEWNTVFLDGKLKAGRVFVAATASHSANSFEIEFVDITSNFFNPNDMSALIVKERIRVKADIEFDKKIDVSPKPVVALHATAYQLLESGEEKATTLALVKTSKYLSELKPLDQSNIGNVSQGAKLFCSIVLEYANIGEVDACSKSIVGGRQ